MGFWMRCWVVWANEVELGSGCSLVKQPVLCRERIFDKELYCA